MKIIKIFIILFLVTSFSGLKSDEENNVLKNKILKRYVSLLNKDRNSIIIANKKDIKFAQKKNGN